MPGPPSTVAQVDSSTKTFQIILKAPKKVLDPNIYDLQLCSIDFNNSVHKILGAEINSNQFQHLKILWTE